MGGCKRGQWRKRRRHGGGGGAPKASVGATHRTVPRCVAAGVGHACADGTMVRVVQDRKVQLANEKVIGNGSFGVVFQVRRALRCVACVARCLRAACLFRGRHALALAPGG